MKPDRRFLGLPKPFWANVRTIGQAVGYTVRGEGRVRVPSMEDIRQAYAGIGLAVSHLIDEGGTILPLGGKLMDYFEHRAKVLNEFVQPRLMDAARARKVFVDLRAKLKPSCPLPMNKQKGKKRAPAYLTGIVNMLVEANAGNLGADFDPRQLTTVTRDGVPLRTLARRIDGAFPGTVNPVAVWEIKEYYHTTTFGSRVADGIYETLLDGMELQELAHDEGIHVEHLLIVDAHYTWWECGKSYLCRILDMLHMGYVDEVLFGYEVVERLPEIAREWVRQARERKGK
jgi:hypothetical protein